MAHYVIGEAYMDYDCDIRYKLGRKKYVNLDKALEKCRAKNAALRTVSNSMHYRVVEVD